MKKNLIDNIVLLIVLWISIPLTFFEGSLFLDISNNLLTYSMLGLYIVNFFSLMWTWHRFGPTRIRKTRKTDDD